RAVRKQSLISAYPGLLTGPDGAVLKRYKGWAPWYILSATIPQSRLRSIFTTTDLRIALVVWRHSTENIIALSVYNNHLDAKASFSTFTVDGASTSRNNPWAVGEKGKGFILATQFLFETVEAHERSRIEKKKAKLPKDIQGAVSFRVGHQIGTLKWKKFDEDDLLQVVLDDLTPLTPAEYVKKQGVRHAFTTDSTRNKNQNANHTGEEDDSDDSEIHVIRHVSVEETKLLEAAKKPLKRMYDRRVTQQLDRKSENAKTFNNDGRCLVSSDEVAITVIGLDGSFMPEYLFSAIYGIIPPRHTWRVPGSPVQFFIAADDANADSQTSTKAKFYHRDQFVPYGIHLNKLSINYHGDLTISADRVSILTNNSKMVSYRHAVSTAADRAFQTIPDLALELALDVLSEEHSEGLAGLVRPTDKTGANAYRKAFEAAMRQMHPEIAGDAMIHPTAGSVDDELFKELGLTSVAVSSKAWDVLEKSGAYVSLKDYARQSLLAAPIIPDTKGLERLRVALSVLAPDVPQINITIRDYSKSSPHVVWDKDKNLFAFGLPPKCDDHPAGQCLCLVGPFLHDAAKDY
ncbi:hypothetical protein B0H11DRAFT_1647676, partial [Mycena galericulata]